MAYMPLNKIRPSLDELFTYRLLLGARSLANSLINLANPLRTTTSRQGVFHPAYLKIHQKATLLLNHENSLAMKGEGGETEFRPDTENRKPTVFTGQACYCRSEVAA
jgi:anthranilate phosphoribosyltransferase